MAKYGLGQLDLNLLVQLSLAGLLDEPEHHLSKLLKSGQPIEDRTRRAIADALDGRSGTIRMQIRATKQHDFVRRFRKQRRQIELGRRVWALAKRQSFTSSVREIVNSSAYGEKSIERFATMANKLTAWMEECRKKGSAQSDLALEMAFVYACIKNIEYEDALRPSVEGLASLIDQFEGIVLDAKG